MALLAELSLGERSGYELGKTFMRAGTRAWHMTRPQIYDALKGLARDGLVMRRIVRGRGRPDRHPYSLTDRGRSASRDWLGTDPAEPSLKDELLLRAQAATKDDQAALLVMIERRRAASEVKLATLAAERAALDPGSAKTQIQRLNLEHLVDLEEARLKWCAGVAAALSQTEPVARAIGRPKRGGRKAPRRRGIRHSR